MHHFALLRYDTLLRYTQLALLLLLAQLIKLLHEETSREKLEQAVPILDSTMYVTCWGVEPARRRMIHPNRVPGLDSFSWTRKGRYSMHKCTKAIEQTDSSCPQTRGP